VIHISAPAVSLIFVGDSHSPSHCLSQRVDLDNGAAVLAATSEQLLIFSGAASAPFADRL